jgi:Zn-dependent protease with chaperone function
MVRLVLGLKPLPPGPARDRLVAAARRLRFRCSEVLLWNTRGAMANAMVLGLLPWPRYVIFTDRFLEEFTGDETEAVFGHEVGHVKHHHMLYYAAFLLLSLAVMWLAGMAAAEWMAQSLDPYPWAAALVESVREAKLGGAATVWWGLPAAAGLLAYLFVVFGLLSRRCERQADVYGCRAVSCGRPDCDGHGPETDLAPGGRSLCPTGVATFVRALEKVCVINGLSRSKPGFFQSWQHGSIARRVAFLRGLVKDPSAEPRFQRQVFRLTWGLIGALSAVLAVLLAAANWSEPAPRGTPQTDQSPPTGAASDRNSSSS